MWWCVRMRLSTTQRLNLRKEPPQGLGIALHCLQTLLHSCMHVTWLHKLRLCLKWHDYINWRLWSDREHESPLYSYCVFRISQPFSAPKNKMAAHQVNKGQVSDGSLAQQMPARDLLCVINTAGNLLYAFIDWIYAAVVLCAYRVFIILLHMHHHHHQ